MLFIFQGYEFYLQTYIISHTEGTEIRKWHRENDETKSDGGIAYRFLITLRINALFIN